MAKKSKVAKNNQRMATVEKYYERRQAALAILKNINSTADEVATAQAVLQRMPRDASPTRIRNRGVSDGRPRGYLRKFGLSRVQFREKALSGDLPGVTKSSW